MAVNVLFMLNSDRELEVNKLEAKKIKEYAVLFNRDKGSIGDSEGRKKLIATAEIFYIYLVYDVRSIYYNLPIDYRKKKAIEDAGLPPTWKEDKEVLAAIERYKEDFKLTSAGLAYAVAEKAYHSTARDTQELQEELMELKELAKHFIAKTKGQTIHEGNKIELTDTVSQITAILSEITKVQKQVLDNIKTFSSLGNTVKELAAKFTEEGGSLRTPVGGGEIYNREE